MGSANSPAFSELTEEVRQMTLKTRFIFIVSFLFVGASTVIGQTVYEIEGTVYGPDSKSLANVAMTLQNHAGAQVDQDITKSDGRYRFSEVVAGVYYISVKPADATIQSQLLRIELINSGVSIRNFSKERFDFSLKKVASASPVVGTIFAQAIPPDAQKEFQSAIDSISKGDKSTAINKLKKAIELFPTYFLALQQLGLLYVETEKDKQALEPLQKAIAVNPKAAQSHLGLGIAFVNLDKLNEAVTELNLALSLDSRLFNAHLYLGMALITMGKLDDAERSLKQAYSIGGPVGAKAVHLYLASIYDKRKEYQKAINELEAYLRENPKAANAAKIREAISKLKAKV
jgi:tetratricopeptide (TPR) repeat protein